MLKPESFYVAAHRVIFREIRGLFRAGKPTDLLSLANVIEAKKLDAETGGFAYLAEISRSATLSAMVHYAGIVREKSILRYAVEKLHACIGIMNQPTDTSATERLGAVQQVIGTVAEYARTGK
ncbi:DnaB-like helicase N-terminal domain-containing protein, partial [Shigella flexneri]